MKHNFRIFMTIVCNVFHHTMKKRFLYLPFSLIVSIFIFSFCESRDGDWEPMKWKTDAKMDKERVIHVPVDGGTYVFKCKNYNNFWLSNVLEDDKDVSIDNKEWRYAIGEWSNVAIEKSVMTVTVSPNDDNRSRLLKVTPTAGDIFTYFLFNQEGMVGDKKSDY